MKLGKCLNVVLALMMASAIIWGQRVEAQQAPILDSVEITAPDSGAIRGIDSTFTVKVTVIDATPDSEMLVYMWLVTDANISGDSALETNVPLADATSHGTVTLLRGGDGTDADEIEDTAKTVDLDDALEPLLGSKPIVYGTDSYPLEGATTSIVAAVQILDTEAGTYGADKTSNFGDASAVAVQAFDINDNTEKFEFTFTGVIPASAGTVSSVRAGAYAVANGVGSDIVYSGTGVTFIVDGDRPTQADLAFLEDPVTAFAVNGFWDGPTDVPAGNATLPDGLDDVGVYIDWSGGTAPVNVINFSNVTDRQVAGIGDTLHADINTSVGGTNGLITNLLFFPNSFPVADRLTMKLQIQGVFSDVNLATRRGEVVRNRLVFADGQGYGDLATAIAPSVDADDDHIDDVTNKIITVDDNGNVIIRGFTVDRAGNLSSVNYSGSEGGDGDTDKKTFLEDDVMPIGFSIAADFFADTKPPALDALNAAPGDTILPVANDTISDGSIFAGEDDDGFHLTAGSKDELLTWRLAEALQTLKITFSQSGSEVANLSVTNSNLDVADENLMAGVRRWLNFTDVADAKDADGGDADKIGENKATVTKGASGGNFDEDGQREVTSGSYDVNFAADAGTIGTGVYDITFQGTDLAGNAGPALARGSIYVDATPLAFQRLFPTEAGLGDQDIDTVNEETAAVVFRLSEEADSVSIVYTPESIVSGSIEEVNFPLAGSLLTNLGEQEVTGFVDSLVHGNDYELRVIGRDLAGNFTRVGPEKLRFDTTYVVPLISGFFLSLEQDDSGACVDGTLIDIPDTTHDPCQLGLVAADHLLAGADVDLQIRAVAADDRDAVTYEGNVSLIIDGGSGVTVTGDGVTAAGSGTWNLDLDEWLVGRYQVTIKDTAAIDTLRIRVLDAAGPFPGQLDSAIVFNPQVYSQLVVSAPDTVTYGEDFSVGVKLSDQFGNARVSDTRWVEVEADNLGASVPNNAIAITDGWGSFTASAHSDGWVTLTVRDIVQVSNNDVRAKDGTDAYDGAYPGGVADVGKDFIAGSSKIYVNSDVAIDRPDTLIAADYRGADGAGDQGGFVKLVFDLSDDHGSIDGYRIWRQVAGEHGVDENGGIVALEEPADSMVPWAFADAVPGVSMMTVIVATLDNVATHWAVSAEMGGFTTAKQAFQVGEVVENPYELMSETMIQSRELAQVDPNAPVFATLTPEALAFVEQGIVPRFKGVGDVQQSLQVRTVEPVRGIDNIAPVAVEFMRAIDTPGDAGGSITVDWTKSESDALMPRMASSAVGPALSDMIPGVLGYQILRSVGGEDFALIGKAGAGETSFVDDTVFNGERYSYSVRPYDQDNVTDSDLSRTTMAIRNSVFDASGVQVFGLFGADNRVGFDDFFVFADHFGLTAGDEAFEPAFDLRQNNRVDFEDFFVFADNFGRAIEAAGKLLPTRSGLNSDARFFLSSMGDLANAGEETQILVNLADFAELKGYGFTLEYDANDLEFVKVTPVDNNLLGEAALSQPRVITQKDGEVSIAAYGEAAVEGELAVNLVFRFKEGTEESFVELTQAQLRDDGFAVNQVASLDRFRIETRPESFALLNNFPNPFNPETTIKYQLPESADVKLEIRNVVGQLVRTLVAEHQSAGRYTVQWDASNDNGQQLSSGVYFYLVEAGEFRQVKRMLLLK